MPEAAWLVGSVTMPDQAFDGGTGSNNVEVPGGTYYLRHATAALSLIDTVAALWTAEWGAAVTITLRQNRLIRITITGGAAIVWDDVDGTILRDLLGFAGNSASAVTHDADYPSPLLFSAGFPATPKTIEGVDGYTISHQSRYKSDDGTQVYVAHYGDEIWQELGWSHILPERMRVTGTTIAQGGTFHQFYEQVGKLGRRFFWYPEVDEDDASTSAVTWPTGLGPYVLREADGDWYRRNVPNAEISCSLELPLHIVAELT